VRKLVVVAWSPWSETRSTRFNAWIGGHNLGTHKYIKELLRGVDLVRQVKVEAIEKLLPGYILDPLPTMTALFVSGREIARVPRNDVDRATDISRCPHCFVSRILQAFSGIRIRRNGCYGRREIVPCTYRSGVRRRMGTRVRWDSRPAQVGGLLQTMMPPVTVMASPVM
jgi:hypothetical protein